MPSASLSKIVLCVRRPSDNNEQAQEHESELLSPTAAHGIVLGTGWQAKIKLQNDPEVDAAHGTLERTSGRGVWVYSDHSTQGSILNGELKVHNNAVVIHHGDKLKLGRTEIELCLKTVEKASVPEEEDDMTEEKESVSTNQDGELSARSAARLARRRASTPWGTAVSKAQQAKQRLPRIETSGLGFESGTLVQPMATPPEYTASPVSGMRWGRKRNSIATTTLMARRSPSPPLEQHGHPHSSHRPRARLIQGPDGPLMPLRHEPQIENTEKTARPPPLEYSSSPSVSPSSVAARQRHNLFQQPPNSLPIPASGVITGVPPPPFSAGARPTSRRDDLRIQVSKKMAAAAPASAGTDVPRVMPTVLNYPTPSSPVAQRDILKQQESLQTILQHKFEEEQLLKQQQEEWMRTNVLPVSSIDTAPPLSPIKSEKKANMDPGELAFFPVQTPVLLRTLSLGITEQHTLRPSPRLTAAIRASRSRLNSFDEKHSEPKHCDLNGRRKTTALVLSPDMQNQDDRAMISPMKECELRTSEDSVASTATTVITCHRRVTSSSLSSGSASSVDLGDFVGYEEEEDNEDTVISYTTPDLYGSAELLRRSREDMTMLFDANFSSSDSANSVYGTLSPPLSSTLSSSSPSNAAADTRLGSPRRGTDTPDAFISSSNQLRNDRNLDRTSPLGSRMRGPRRGPFDPQSPYKSSAVFFKNQQAQNLRRPAPELEDVEGGWNLPRQPKPQSSRRRASFRRHSLTPLTGMNKPS